MISLDRLKRIKRKFLLKRQFLELSVAPRPWLVPGAVAYIEEWIERKKNVEVLEFGGGSSTLWFLSKVAKLHTHEANADWASLLLDYMSGKPELASKWRLTFVNCDWNIDEFGKRWYIKNGHTKTDDDVKEEMENDFLKTNVQCPDLILIDGSIRAKTLVAALKILECSDDEALLVVDNTDKEWRDRYTRKFVPKEWKRLDFINQGSEYVDWVEKGSRTTIWIKLGSKTQQT